MADGLTSAALGSDSRNDPEYLPDDVGDRRGEFRGCQVEAQHNAQQRGRKRQPVGTDENDDREQQKNDDGDADHDGREPLPDTDVV